MQRACVHNMDAARTKRCVGAGGSAQPHVGSVGLLRPALLWLQGAGFIAIQVCRCREVLHARKRINKCCMLQLADRGLIGTVAVPLPAIPAQLPACLHAVLPRLLRVQGFDQQHAR